MKWIIYIPGKFLKAAIIFWLRNFHIGERKCKCCAKAETTPPHFVRSRNRESVPAQSLNIDRFNRFQNVSKVRRRGDPLLERVKIRDNFQQFLYQLERHLLNFCALVDHLWFCSRNANSSWQWTADFRIKQIDFAELEGKVGFHDRSSLGGRIEGEKRREYRRREEKKITRDRRKDIFISGTTSEIGGRIKRGV